MEKSNKPIFSAFLVEHVEHGVIGNHGGIEAVTLRVRNCRMELQLQFWKHKTSSGLWRRRPMKSYMLVSVDRDKRKVGGTYWTKFVVMDAPSYWEK